MLAILSLLIGTALGVMLWEAFAPKGNRALSIAAGFIIGQTLQATLIYFAAYLFEALDWADRLNVRPLLPANIIVHVLSLFIVILTFVVRSRKRPDAVRPIHLPDSSAKSVTVRRRRLLILTMIGAVAFAYMMTRFTFRFEGNNLLAGVSVFSDFAPHTAVMRSFSAGQNLPTSYPHFAGDGISYHFFFYFLCANLNYLGLPLDIAMNLPSLLSMLAFVHLLGTLAYRLTGRLHAYWLSPALVAFRSSFSVWTWLSTIRSLSPEAMQTYPELGMFPPGSEPSFGEAWRILWQGTRFVGTLPRDDWGLFASNVYANQRHLIWGICLLLIIIILWSPSLQEGLAQTERGSWGESAKQFFRKPMWSGFPWRPLLLSVLLLMPFPYWHGSTLIVLLMVLFVMALRSRHKPVYIAMALVSIGASLILTGFFSNETAAGIEPAFQWGFLLGEHAGLGLVLAYLFTLFGIAFPLMLILPWWQKTSYAKTLSIAALLPLIFALTISLTTDITVNHKFFMLSYILLTPALAGFVLDLLHNGIQKIRGGDLKNLASRRMMLQGVLSMGLAVIMSFLLTINGIVDLKVYINKNEQKVGLQANSEFVKWLENNTDPQELFITPPWSYHAFFYSGRLSNYGHSYYAWSAGHDTDGRLQEQNRWLSGELPVEVWTEEARARNVRWLIVTDESRHMTDTAMQPPVNTERLELVASFPEEGNMEIYRLY